MMKRISFLMILLLVVLGPNANGQYYSIGRSKIDTSRLEWSGTVVNGVRENEWTAKNAAGKTRVVTYFTGGRLNGTWSEYYENGDLKESGLYSMGNKLGVWVLYYSTKDTMAVCNFENGVLVGPYRDYYRFNLHRANGRYTDGGRSGKWEYLNERGIASRIEWYDLPVVDTMYQNPAYTNGVKKIHSIRVVERPDSIYVYSNESYFVESKTVYRDTSIFMWAQGGVATVVNYYKGSNIVESTSTLLMNRPYGITTQFTKNGTVSSRISQGGWQPNGLCEWFYDTGKIRARDSVMNGSLTSNLKLYDRKGKLISISSSKYELMLDSISTISGLPKPPKASVKGEAKKNENAPPAFEIPEVIVPSPPNNTVSDPDEVHAFSEVMPTFKGGEAAFQKYLADNLVHPSGANDSLVEGIVFIYFEVTRDGQIEKVQPKKGISGHPAFALEAERVLKAMPAWNPGTMNGKPVRVSLTVPVKFVVKK